MPPRKANPRPSNVSTARFALKDDVAPTEPALAPAPEAPKAATPVAEASAAQAAPEKKQDREKSKEAEKKKKEEHDDNITIEVSS